MEKKLAVLLIIIGAALIAYGFATDITIKLNSYLRFIFLFMGIMMITLTYMFVDKKG